MCGTNCGLPCKLSEFALNIDPEEATAQFWDDVLLYRLCLSRRQGAVSFSSFESLKSCNENVWTKLGNKLLNVLVYTTIKHLE